MSDVPQSPGRGPEGVGPEGGVLGRGEPVWSPQRTARALSSHRPEDQTSSI